ncbi:MAG: insulinase family protein [Alphaproteobacteria bacterium]|nr:insulinase family protein [Alphaproteobacteria bacterium]
MLSWLTVAVVAGGAVPALAVAVVPVTSPGGITAWLVEDHSVPIISLRLLFRGGTAIDPPGREGLAALTANLLDEGAAEYDSQAFQTLLSDNSITLSFSSGPDNFGGTLRTLVKKRDLAFDLLRLSIIQPRFDQEPTERVRGQVQNVISRSANDPDQIAGRVFFRTVLPNHPYGRPSRGTAESVTAITRDDMRQFVADRFARDNLVLAIVGDITAAELAPLLDKTFGALPANSKPFNVIEAAPKDTGEVIVAEWDVPQSTVLFGQKGLKRSDPDFYSAYVLNYILGGSGFTARLYQEVREARGLAYSVYSYLSTYEHAGLVLGSAGTANGRVAETIEVVRQQWAKMRDGEVGQAELDDAKAGLTGSFAIQFETTNSVANTLVSMQTDNLGIDYIDRRNAYIEAVTLADIKRVAKRLLNPESLVFVIVGKPEGVTATRTQTGG